MPLAQAQRGYTSSRLGSLCSVSCIPLPPSGSAQPRPTVSPGALVVVRVSPGALLVLGSVLALCWCWTRASPCERVCVGRAEGWRVQADSHSAACCSLAGRRNARERRGAHRTPSLRGPSSCSWRPPRTGAACSWSPPPPDHAHQCERSQETWLGDTFATFVVSTH